MPFDRVIRVVPSAADITVPWPFEIENSTAEITVEVIGAPTQDTFGYNVIRAKLQVGGSDIAADAKLTGTLTAQSIIGIDDNLYEIAEPLMFTGGNVVISDILYIPPRGFRSNPTTWIFAETLTEALRKRDFMQFSAGLKAIGSFVGFGDPKPITGGTIRSIGNALGQGAATTARGLSGGFAFPFTARGAPILNPVPPFQTSLGTSIKDLGAVLPFGQSYIRLRTPLQSKLVDGNPITLNVNAGPTSSSGVPTWAELDDYSIADSVGAQGDLVAVALSTFTVRYDPSLTHDAIVIDDEDEVWQVRGVERVGRRLSRIQCQREIRRGG